MPTPVTSQPFIIRPPADFLTRYPALKRNSNTLARAYARGDFVTEDRLRQVGSQLWQLLSETIQITDEFSHARTQAGNQHLPIIIESKHNAIHQLPWETLHHPQFGFLAKANGFSLVRSTGAPQAQLPAPEKGPLRVLIFTSLPDDLDGDRSRLDVEEEQAQILEALTPHMADNLVQLTMPNDGRFVTLQKLLKETQPHLVFLSGHGKFVEPQARDDRPYALFQFESESGASHRVHEDEMADAFRGCAVECVVLSACESAMTSVVATDTTITDAADSAADHAPSDALNAGLTWCLSQLGIPHLIGMRESVLDRAGTLFARQFCDAVARQEPIHVALQEGRQAISRSLKESFWLHDDASGLAEKSLGQWSLPMLIAPAPERPLIDWDFDPQPIAQQLSSQTLQSINLPPRFIGRRSELRQLQSRLRQGALGQLLITGPGGQGKTALAGKLAQDLARQGYQILAWSARPENQWLDFQLEMELLLTADNIQRYTLMAPRYDKEEDRAHLLLRLLMQQTDNHIALFFDNLESLQETTDRALTDPTVAAWIGAAQRLTSQGLILLLTSRWLLPQWPAADHWPLDRAEYGDFLQMALQLVQQEKLIPAFVRQRDRLRRVYTVLHGNGRGLTFFAAALQTMGGDAQSEAAFLESLQQATSKTQSDMALKQIVAHLSTEATELLQRLRVYRASVPIEGVIKIGLDLPQPPAELLMQLLAVSLVEQSRAYDLQTTTYRLPPLVGDWLEQQELAPPEATFWRAAARYQQYLFRNERCTLPQAMTVHQALDGADETDARDRFALDWIVGWLNRAGLYQTLLDEWLPPICASEASQIRAEALGQTGKQLIHIGSYETALKYLEESLKIRQEIGDVAGLCATLFNRGHIHWQNENVQEAVGSWVTVYRLAKPRQLAQALDALANLAPNLGLEGGLDGWEALSKQLGEGD